MLKRCLPSMHMATTAPSGTGKFATIVSVASMAFPSSRSACRPVSLARITVPRRNEAC